MKSYQTINEVKAEVDGGSGFAGTTQCAHIFSSSMNSENDKEVNSLYDRLQPDVNILCTPALWLSLSLWRIEWDQHTSLGKCFYSPYWLSRSLWYTTTLVWTYGKSLHYRELWKTWCKWNFSPKIIITRLAQGSLWYFDGYPERLHSRIIILQMKMVLLSFLCPRKSI